MKIALVTLAWHGHGGIERNVMELAEGLAAKGDEVHVFAASFEGAAPQGVQFHAVPVLARPWALRLIQFAQQAPRAVAAQGPFDIIHAHTAYAGNCDCVSAHSVHRVALFHTPPAPGLAGWRERLLGFAPWVVRTSDRAYRNARLRIANSQVIARELETCYGNLPTRTVYLGVDTGLFKHTAPREKAGLKRALGLDPGRFWFCFSGWNWRRKGLDLVLSALSTLPKRSHLLVIGEDKSEGEAFRRQAAGLGNRVVFAGRQTEPQRWMRACDAFVFPTRYEPFGLVVMEAMACGLPVLVPRNAGVHEVLGPGDRVQVMQEGVDAPALALAMRQFLEKPALAASLGRDNRRRSLTRNWAAHVAKIRALYRSLVREIRPLYNRQKENP